MVGSVGFKRTFRDRIVEIIEGEKIPDDRKDAPGVWEKVSSTAGLKVVYDNELPYNKARAARWERDRLLLRCDWTHTKDGEQRCIQKGTLEAWAAYRQALCDVPQQAGFPSRITWPEPPT